jgi:hypothetical protein
METLEEVIVEGILVERGMEREMAVDLIRRTRQHRWRDEKLVRSIMLAWANGPATYVMGA